MVMKEDSGIKTKVDDDLSAIIYVDGVIGEGEIEGFLWRRVGEQTMETTSEGRKRHQTASDSAAELKSTETTESLHASAGVVRDSMWAMHPSGNSILFLLSHHANDSDT